MKKKLLVVLLAISMTSAMLTGCLPIPILMSTDSQEDNKENDIEKMMKRTM